MTENRAIICPACGKLISNYLEECPYCELKNPARKHNLMRFLGGGQKNYVKIIITINVVIYISLFILPFFIPGRIPAGRDILGLLPAPSSAVLNLLGWAEIRSILSGNWWVLITAMFLHGGILHILFNMLWVRDLGPQTSMFFGSHNMLTIYILSGVGGNLVAVFTPLIFNMLLATRMPFHPVIGASGAVFGLMGAIMAYGRKRGGIFGRQLVRQLGLWAAILIIMGFIFPGISNAAHIGGFITGFLIGQIIPIQPKLTSKGFSMLVSILVSGMCLLAFLMMLIRLFRVLGRL